MKRLLMLTILMIAIVLISKSAIALSIISPKEGQTVYAGDKLTVIAKPDPGEKWVAVSFGFDAMSYNPFKKEYKITIDVPKDYSGYYDNLYVVATDRDGKTVKLKTAIYVKISPNIVLQSIIAGNSGGGSLVVLEKMPIDSSAIDIENFGSEQLGVYGRYSDNVNRKLTSSITGTTYTSSDEQVATVSPDGKVTAQGIGEARITVKNGIFRSIVDVIVKAYKE